MKFTHRFALLLNVIILLVSLQPVVMNAMTGSYGTKQIDAPAAPAGDTIPSGIKRRAAHPLSLGEAASEEDNAHAKRNKKDSSSPERSENPGFGGPWAAHTELTDTFAPAAPAGDSKRAAVSDDDDAGICSLDDSPKESKPSAAAAPVTDDNQIKIQAKRGSVEFSFELLKRYSGFIKTIVASDQEASPDDYAKELSKMLQYPSKATLQAFKTVLEAFDRSTEINPRKRIEQTIHVLDTIYKQSTIRLLDKPNPEIIAEICSIALALDIKPITILCHQWFIKNHKKMCELMWSPELPIDCMRTLSQEYSLHEQRSGITNLKSLTDHCFLPDSIDLSDIDLTSKSRTPKKEAEILWHKLRDVKEINTIIEQMPRSPLKDLVIEKIIANNYTNLDFDFLFWYNQLSPGRDDANDINSVRSRVLKIMQTGAEKFVGDSKTADIAAITPQFFLLPEGYFKMLVRQQFQAVHGTNIQESIDGTIPPMVINDIMARINNANGHVYLSRKELTTFAGFDALLVVRNEIRPIINLDLSYNQLTAITIPATLTALQRLYLPENKLTAITIPATLTALQTLDFSGNQLTAITIPATLIALENLYLRQNQLTAVTIPATLTALQALVLSYNQLTVITIPATLTALQTLYLSYNQLTVITIPATLTALQRLHLLGNQLAVITIPATLTALQGLYLSRNQLTAITIPATLTALRDLYLSDNQLTAITIPATLTALQGLYLSYNKLTVITIPATLTALRDLYLSDNQLTEEQKIILSARFGDHIVL